MKTKFLFLMAVCLLAVTTALAQNRTIKGQVVSDSDGEPLVGASIVQKGTSNGVITDIDGNFTLSVPNNSILAVSFVGFTSQQVKPTSNQIVIRLKEDAALLGDVVVVGYGTMKKADITGSVVSIDTESMMKRAPTNVGQGLQGTAPGVMVTMQDGAPEAKAQIRIRGVATINGSAAPLYVVDGIQVGTNADFVSPSDIESIDILKDASATAIYGSAGANGVIMITTKKGSKGHANINVSADFGIQTLSNTLDVCGIDQYAKNLRQARINDGSVDASGNPIMWNPIWTEAYDGKRNSIDWQDQMTRAAWRQNYNISTSGGNDKTVYSGSLGFLRNDGIVVNTQYQRITARANVHTDVNKYISFGAEVNYSHTDANGSNNSVGNFGNLSSLRDYAFACPTMDFVTSNTVTYDGVAAGTYVSPQVVNPDGSYGEVTGGKNFNDGMWGTTLGNMYAKQMELRAKNRTNRALSTAYLSIKPVEGLEWKTVLAYDYNSNSYNNFTGGDYIQRVNYVNGNRINVTQGTGDAYYNPRNNNDYTFNLSNGESQTLDIQNTLTYNWKNDIHNVTLMLGNEVSRYYGQWASAEARGYDSKDIRDISLTTQSQYRNGSGAFNLESRKISYFGRANYSLMDRYLLTATLRRDGSSNFGAGNRWGTFPSFAAGWRVSEEAFMQNQDIVSNLKLRFGWGQTGNSGGATDLSVTGLNIDGRYVYYNQGAAMGLGTGTPNVSTGFYPVLKDTNLKWETNEQLNFGLDASFLNNELVFGFDFFVRTSKDLLLYRQIRSSSGYTQIYTNYGEIQNKGVELSLAYNHRVNKDFAFNAMVTGSTLSNKVKKMGDPLYNTNSDSSGQGTGDGSNTGAVGSADGYHWGNHSVCMEGEAVGSFYGYRVDKIIRTEEDLAKAKAQGQTAKLGDYLFKDLDDNGTLNEADREVLGNGFPSLNFGINLGAQYKDFDFNIQMHGVLGQKIFSYSAMRLNNMFSSDDGCAPNILKSAANNAWSESNPNGNNCRLSFLDENYNMRASDAWIKNGNYLKISNVQIGYTVPKNIVNKLMIQNARIYFGIQNLVCFSPYNKYGDPECGQGSVLYTGLDTGRYPMPRTYNFGLNVTF